MASMNPRTRFLLIALTTLLCFLQCAYCVEIEVGERKGWVVPPANDTAWYNEWASKRRFKIGDTIRFKYRKDSVMEVEKGDYKACNSTRPNFFSNTGNTMYALDRSGFFYFISGATDHCEKGQRMIVWVIAQDGSGPPSSYASNSAIVPYGLFVAMLAFQFVYLH